LITFTSNTPLLNHKLQQHFAFLESQRAALVARVRNVTPEQLNGHQPGAWSLSQVLAHLIASEQLSVRYLKKKIQGIESAPNTGMLETLTMWALIVSQRLPLKFKAPKVVTENTPTFSDVHQIIAAWDQCRHELKDLLSAFSEDQLNRQIYKHPIAGKLNIQQALRFFREHIIHHEPQIKKLLKQQ
jgi:uncharacterized damage-inducible protein DinB